MLPYLFTQRDVHSTTVKESLKPRLELGTQTHDALRPACRTSSASNAEKLNANAPKGQFLSTIRNANDVFMIFFVFSRV
jgi:hypothetical protein